MTNNVSLERVPCPSCGGAGGGPFGPSGSAWDDEEYVCPRCEGEGMLLVANDVLSQRPGLVKAARDEALRPSESDKRKAAG